MYRWRDPQLQVNENYSNLTKWRSAILKSLSLMSRFMFNMLKSWYIMRKYKMCSKLQSTEYFYKRHNRGCGCWVSYNIYRQTRITFKLFILSFSKFRKHLNPGAYSQHYNWWKWPFQRPRVLKRLEKLKWEIMTYSMKLTSHNNACASRPNRYEIDVKRPLHRSMSCDESPISGLAVHN